MQVESGRANDEMEAELLIVLRNLWDAHQESPQKPWSLAKLSKRTRRPMSSLRRLLTVMESGNLISMVIRDDGIGYASLTLDGRVLCDQVFGGGAFEEPSQ